MAQTLKFLVGREKDGTLNSNKSCYYKKGGVLVIINCGHGVVEAMRKTGVLKGVEQVYQIITHTSKEHLFDLKKFFDVLNKKGIKPNLIDSISLNKTLVKKMKLTEGKDFEYVSPLKQNFKWINFLATPHKNKTLSCPVELVFDDKKIFYGGDCGEIPFSIENYDEYYFDFSELTDEYNMDIKKLKKLAQKNKIAKEKLWLVHLTSRLALEYAEKARLQVAQEEKAKLILPPKQTKNAKDKAIIK